MTIGACGAQRDARGHHALSGHLPQAEIDALAGLASAPSVSVTDTPLLGVRLARRLERLPVDWLWLWTDVTAPAMRHVLRMPGLRMLDVLRVTLDERMPSLRDARGLQVARINCGLSAHALQQVAQCEGLQELGVQGAELTRASLAAVLAVPRLERLDLECTAFDDRMARRLSSSSSIAELDVGATRLTRAGLAHLVRMPQLRALDLWATGIEAADLALLAELPRLEYLSVGGRPDDEPMDGDALATQLLALPGLRRAWLDGVAIAPMHVDALREKLDTLRIT